MSSSDSIERRCKQVKESLYSLASVLLDETPSPAASRPPTSAEVEPPRSEYHTYEDMPLSSARSNNELQELRSLLDLEQGKVSRLTEQLHSQEASYQALDSLMKELYQSIDDLKAQNDSLTSELSRFKGLDQHCDALRKQINAFQTTVAQKERLLTAVDQEREELAQKNDILRRKLDEIALPEVSEYEVRLQGEIRRLGEENEELAITLKATSEENERLLCELRSLSSQESLTHKVSELQHDITQVCEDRDRLIRTVAFKETEIRDIRTRLSEKEGNSKPPEWVTKERDAIIPGLLAILGQRTPESILPTVESLLSFQKKGASALQIVEKLGKLIQDCAPDEAAATPPTNKQIWRWVRRLVEEYMSLKRKIADIQRHSSAEGCETKGAETAIRIHDKD